jgi:hypothetical protein
VKKQPPALDTLITAPWQIPANLGLIAYLLLQYWLPTVTVENSMMEGIRRGLLAAENLFLGAFLLITALSAFHG